MKLIRYFLLLLLASPALAQTSGVTFNWATDGNPGVPVCSATVTTSCKSNLALSDITSLSSPVVINNDIADTLLTYSLTPLPSVGPHTYSLIVVGKDQSGNQIVSPAATATVTVPAITLNPPTGFTVTP